VQGDPGSDVSVRYETDREVMAELRAFAAELFSEGAPAVLALPPLPPELAASVLQLIAAELQKRPRGSQLLRLAALASRIRQEIAGWQPPDAPDPAAANAVQANIAKARPARRSKGGEPAPYQQILLEKAFDVTLFARPES
jgi:hypothetical protein